MWGRNRREQAHDAVDGDEEYGRTYGAARYADEYDEQDAMGGYEDEGSYDEPQSQWNERALVANLDADQAQGLLLQREQSLVNVSTTVTHHGTPLLSYTRTMSRFYTNRKQRFSAGRFKCEVCGERIRFWAWETGNGNRTHDGCYERLAWMWTNLYAQQQRMAAEGNFE